MWLQSASSFVGRQTMPALRSRRVRPPNVVTVALANKTACTIWALLAHDRAYQANCVTQPV